MKPSSQGRVPVLLVEDNEADVRLCREVFAEGPYRIDLAVARDGEEALERLARPGPFDREPLPALILLDLNLPRKDGREVLEAVKSSPYLRHIPVIVLTTSRSDLDISRAYELHANSYIVKPVDLARFVEVVRAVEDYWLSISTLPAP